MAPRTSEPGIRPGPMSLLVLTLVVCLSVLCCLALATAAASNHRAEVQTSIMVDSYANELEAQELLSHASELCASSGAQGLAALAQQASQLWPDCTASYEEGRFQAYFAQPSGRSLTVQLSVSPEGQLKIESWCAGMQWEEPSGQWWPGPSSATP